MGFLSTLTGALKEGVRQGLATGITSAIRSSNLLDFTNMQKTQNIVIDMDNAMYSDYNRYENMFKPGMMNSNVVSVKNTNTIPESSADKNKGKVNGSVHYPIPTPDHGVIDDPYTDILGFDIPDWFYL